MTTPAAAGRELPGAADTIAAVATPTGAGALAIVRISGPEAHGVSRALVRRWPDRSRSATYTHVRGPDGDALDTAIVIRYDAPHSFTGEDAVEITCHGGRVVPRSILAAAIEAGAREALPGEFTRRAVYHGKLDLLQAEATGDLIDASSRAAQRVALHQLDGGLSRRIDALRASLIEAEALLAYDIDFPEEDDGPLPLDRITTQLSDVERAIDGLLATTRRGAVIRDGALVVLAGAPNVGKSSLFNALLGQERAIVTDIPGTTRDAIEAVVDIGRWPIRLVDTAGLRESGDALEQLGMAVSERYLGGAAVVLACGEREEDLRSTVSRAAAAGAPVVAVGTKSELGTLTLDALRRAAVDHGAGAWVLVSAREGTGLDALLGAVTRSLDDSVDVTTDDPVVLTRARHRRALETARSEVIAFRDAWAGEQVPSAVAAVHLHTAVAALEDLIGTVGVEDVLDDLFRRFCVGK